MASPYFTLLVEDRAHGLFVYRLLLHWGVARQRIRAVPYPDGKGSGEQHVRVSFPGNLAAHRHSAARRCLVVVTDADQVEVTRRRQHLLEQLAASGVAPPQGDEAVMLIPKRHIEAWLHFVETGQADELNRFDSVYEEVVADVCKAAPPKLDAWLAVEPPAGPPSLLAARGAFMGLRRMARS